MRTMARFLVACIMLSLGIATSAQTVASDSTAQSVGLVLSGGGAKGIAHIGVIQALEDNNIPIDYITGTSMGAIVGGLYAAGYTPQEMLDLILSRGFSYWSTGQIDPDLNYYFSKQQPSPVMLSVPIVSKRDSLENARSAVPASLISPLPMSFAFMELFSAYTAQCGGDFDKLFVPFRCVTSDVAARHKLVMRSGSLGDAVRSSMSFPIVFQPTQIDSLYLYDGGIYDNFPVDVMCADFAPDIMLGIDVSTENTTPQTSIMDQLENLVIQNNDYNLPPELGIKLKIDLNEFGLLDFPQAQRIYKIGYDHAMAIMDSIKSRVHSRVSPVTRNQRRAAFKAATPYIRFDQVNVTGGTPRQNDYIKYLFTGHHAADTISFDKARLSYYRAISSGKLRDLTPHAIYNDTAGLFSLNMKASVKNDFRVGFGGYISSSTASYLYVSAGYSTLSFSSLACNAGIWVGQSYLGANLGGRVFLRTQIPSAIEVDAVAFRHKFYNDDFLFFEDKLPSFIVNHEYYGRLKWTFAAGNKAKVDFGVGVGHLNDSYFGSQTDFTSEAKRDHTRMTLGQAYLRFETNTLDDFNYPTKGHSADVCAMGVLGRAHQDHSDLAILDWNKNVRWVQLSSRTRSYIAPSRHFSLGLESDVMLSTRKLLPGYNASLVAAPSFMPTPSSYNMFNPAFQANSYIAAGLIPIYKYSNNLSARIGFYGFLPLRKILADSEMNAVYSKRWLHNPEFFGEAAVCYRFPFATLTAYCNYSSYPKRNWNGGVTFGIFLLAPKFLR